MRTFKIGYYAIYFTKYFLLELIIHQKLVTFAPLKKLTVIIQI